MDVKTNVGGTFLRLINKHFHRGTKLNKIFNKNSLKVSYSCMPNMSSVIKSHNARVIKGKVDKSPKKMCNCRVKNNCPLNGKCLNKSVVYKATVTSITICQKNILAWLVTHSEKGSTTTQSHSGKRSTVKKLSCLSMCGP